MSNRPAKVYVSPFLIEEEAYYLEVYAYDTKTNIQVYRGFVAYKDSLADWVTELNQWLNSYNVTKVIFSDEELEFQYNLWLNINDEPL